MELIVVSDPGDVPNETSIINRLFEAGLTRFHLRKPGWKVNQFIDLLLGIDQIFHRHIALHQQHYLTNSFGIKRLHYTEQHRINTSQEELQQQNKNGYTLSTSVHHIAHIAELQYFEYAFLGPLFNSISKPGYQSILTNGFCLNSDESRSKVIGLGGINACNLNRVKSMNFDGAAVLGAIWSTPEQTITNFLKIKTVADQLN